MSTSNKRRDAEMMHNIAVDGTYQWMQEIVALHEKAARELRTSAVRFAEAAAAQRAGTPAPTNPVQALSAFVNATKFVALNARHDLAVNHASALALSAAKLGGK